MKTLRIFLLCVNFPALLLVSAVHAGSVTGSFQNLSFGDEINLSSEGTLDWVKYGLSTGGYTGMTGKTGGTEISAVSMIGTNYSANFTDFGLGFTWTDGDSAPTTATNLTTAIFLNGGLNGWSITIGADTVAKTAKIYVGGDAFAGTFTATLSDGGSYSSSALSSSGAAFGVYSVDFAALSAGQTLTVTWVNSDPDSPGSIHIAAASLTTAAIPEPSSAAAFAGLAVVAIAALSRRRRR